MKSNLFKRVIVVTIVALMLSGIVGYAVYSRGLPDKTAGISDDSMKEGMPFPDFPAPSGTVTDFPTPSDSESPPPPATDSPAPDDSEPPPTYTYYTPHTEYAPLPYPAAAIFGITGAEAVVFEAVVDALHDQIKDIFNRDSSMIPYIAVYSTIKNGDLTSYICKIRFEELNDYEPATTDFASVVNAFPVYPAIAEVVVRQDGDNYSIERIEVKTHYRAGLQDFDQVQKFVQRICGTNTELAEAIINYTAKAEAITPPLTELIDMYCKLPKLNISDVRYYSWYPEPRSDFLVRLKREERYVDIRNDVMVNGSFFNFIRNDYSTAADELPEVKIYTREGELSWEFWVLGLRWGQWEVNYMSSLSPRTIVGVNASCPIEQIRVVNDELVYVTYQVKNNDEFGLHYNVYLFFEKLGPWRDNPGTEYWMFTGHLWSAKTLTKADFNSISIGSTDSDVERIDPMMAEFRPKAFNIEEFPDAPDILEYKSYHYTIDGIYGFTFTNPKEENANPYTVSKIEFYDNFELESSLIEGKMVQAKIDPADLPLKEIWG